MLHLLTDPLVIDSTRTEALLGLAPTPFEDAVEATGAEYLAQPTKSADIPSPASSVGRS